MDLERANTRTAACMKAVGSMTSDMERDSNASPTEIPTWASTKRATSTVKASISGSAETRTMENG
jgi:hypothetical protein